MGGRGVISA